MAFNRKFWKRGDKLTTKELNRIEEGIAGVTKEGTDLTISCDLNIETGLTSNWSISIAELAQLINSHTRFLLHLKFFQTNNITNELEQVGDYWVPVSQIIDSKVYFYMFIGGTEATSFILVINKDEDDFYFGPVGNYTPELDEPVPTYDPDGE